MGKLRGSTLVLSLPRVYGQSFLLLHVFFLLVFFVLSFPVVSHAQKPSGSITLPRNFNKGANIAPVDYFLKDVDPYVKNDVFQRERYHMGKEFWEALRGGKLQRALDDLDFVLRYIPNHPKALMVVGFISRAGRNPTIAHLYYQKALRRYPHRALTHAQYGAYLADIGKVNDGVIRLQKAIAIDPNLVSAHLWLAKVYARVGKKDLARQATQRANEARAGRGARNGETTVKSQSPMNTENKVDSAILPQEEVPQ